MARLTNAQLQDQLASLRHNYEQLEAKLIAVTEQRDALQAQLTASSAIAAASKPLTYTRPTSMRGPRPRYEFDPTVPGDFQRAKALAIANGGVIVRAQGH